MEFLITINGCSHSSSSNTNGSIQQQSTQLSPGWALEELEESMSLTPTCYSICILPWMLARYIRTHRADVTNLVLMASAMWHALWFSTSADSYFLLGTQSCFYIRPISARSEITSLKNTAFYIRNCILATTSVYTEKSLWVQEAGLCFAPSLFVTFESACFVLLICYMHMVWKTRHQHLSLFYWLCYKLVTMQTEPCFLFRSCKHRTTAVSVW